MQGVCAPTGIVKAGYLPTARRAEPKSMSTGVPDFDGFPQLVLRPLQGRSPSRGLASP
jgi:hypothetical protein